MTEAQLETIFKKRFIAQIRLRLCGVDLDFIHTQPNNRSMPDTLILGPLYWAALEFKRSEDADRQPNQEYHVDRLMERGYASFVYPENVEEVLDDLERLFKFE